MSQTHYRKVFKSDHLGSADIEDYIEQGHNCVFTVSHVRQEQGAKVAGKKIDANIAYFAEPGVKPMVLNATNSKTLSKLAGSCFVENWQNIPIRIFIDKNVKMKGEVVGGIRIDHRAVKAQLPEVLPGSSAWNNAKAAYKRDGNFNAVFKRASISQQNQQKLIDEVNNEVS